MTKKLTTFLLNLILATNILCAQRTNKETVYFDFNKSDLTTAIKNILDKSCGKVSDRELLQINLTGHTDAEGSNAYNINLSKKRANAVLEYLASNGISKDKIKVEFLGEDKPVTQNKDEQGRQQNRRVELLFVSTERKSEVIPAKDTVAKPTFKVSNIFDKIGKESQFFKAMAKETIRIEGKEGTVINIPQGSLADNNQQIIAGEVEIELKEVYKKSDIVSEGLHTMSDTSILESGGMIFISVTYQGEKLNLMEGEEITIEFAGVSNNIGMETFYGENRDSHINWGKSSNSKPTSIPPTTVSKKAKKERRYAILRIGGKTFGRGGNSGISDSAIIGREDKIILESSKLGWINCDRFYNYTDKTTLTVEVDILYEPAVRLVFKDIKAVMYGGFAGQKNISFREIPVGKKATLIALSFVNDEPYYTSKDIVIRKGQKESLELLKTTLTALKQDLEKLN